MALLVGGLGLIAVTLILSSQTSRVPHIVEQPRSQSEQNRAEPEDRDRGQEAYYLAREVCKNLLKSPSSAKFSNPNSDSGTGWQPDGYYQWKVGGVVEAQNPLGVLLQERWFGVVQVNTGRLEVVYLQVGDQEIGSRPAMRRAPGVAAH